MQVHSSPRLIHALDLSAPAAPDVTLWSAWHGDRIAGVAALRDSGDGNGELKSMRTAPDLLRRGVAAHLLAHIIAVAKDRGMMRLSLETGSGPAFEPALALYRSRGFSDGPPFANYQPSDFNQFLHLDLLEDGVP